MYHCQARVSPWNYQHSLFNTLFPQSSSVSHSRPRLKVFFYRRPETKIEICVVKFQFSPSASSVAMVQLDEDERGQNLKLLYSSTDTRFLAINGNFQWKRPARFQFTSRLVPSSRRRLETIFQSTFHYHKLLHIKTNVLFQQLVTACRCLKFVSTT